MTTTPRVALDALFDRSRSVITSPNEPDGASAAGEVASASAFDDWSVMLLARYVDRIRDIIEAAEAGTPLPDEEMLPARFTFDTGVGSCDADTFFRGRRWPLLSCFFGLAYAAAGQHDEVLRLLNWAASTPTDTGMLLEQVDGHLVALGHREEWLEQRGLVETPPLWSHTRGLRPAAELGVDRGELAA